VLRAPVLLSLAGFVALSIAVRILVLPAAGAQGGVEETLAVQLPARLDQFVIGMLAARAYLARTTPARPTLLLGMALAALAHVVSIAANYGFEIGAARPWFFVHYTATAAALGLLVYACALGSPLAQQLFGNRLLRHAGEISYSLYLWHAPFLLWAASRPSRQGVPTWAILAAALLAGLVVSLLSHRLLERPFQPRRPPPVNVPVAG
jgi:peptidoglycan/LPS O-acetylase OafA/YrhL